MMRANVDRARDQLAAAVAAQAALAGGGAPDQAGVGAPAQAGAAGGDPVRSLICPPLRPFLSLSALI